MRIRSTADALLPRNLACALRAPAKALLLPTMYEDAFNHGGHVPRMIHKPALLCQEWNLFRALPARYFLWFGGSTSQCPNRLAAGCISLQPRPTLYVVRAILYLS
jgi:hypothetical protein